MSPELVTGFRYAFKTRAGSAIGVVASADDRLIRLEGGQALLAFSVQECAPLFVDEFKSFSTDKRKALAKTGAAMPDGSYPIENVSDLHNAVQAYGRSPDTATKNHIVKRAKALGATSALPADWPGSTQGQTASAAEVVPTRDRIRTVLASIRVDRPKK